MAYADGPSAVRTRHQTLARVLVLPIEIAGDPGKRSRKRRVLEHADALLADPDLALVAQALQIVLSATGTHERSEMLGDLFSAVKGMPNIARATRSGLESFASDVAGDVAGDKL